MNLKIEQIKQLAAKKSYKEAAAIAKEMSWHKVKDWNALATVINVQEAVGDYEEARDMAILAYNRNLGGRKLVYKLTEIMIKLKQFDDADGLYEEYERMSQHDVSRYILYYILRKAEGASDNELVEILEDYKNHEIDEKYMYELACLYAKTGRKDECIKACDELALLFQDGIYVEKSMELKQGLGAPLTTMQIKILDDAKLKKHDDEKTKEIMFEQQKELARIRQDDIEEALKEDDDKEAGKPETEAESSDDKKAEPAKPQMQSIDAGSLMAATLEPWDEPLKEESDEQTEEIEINIEETDEPKGESAENNDTAENLSSEDMKEEHDADNKERPDNTDVFKMARKAAEAVSDNKPGQMPESLKELIANAKKKIENSYDRMSREDEEERLREERIEAQRHIKEREDAMEIEPVSVPNVNNIYDTQNIQAELAKNLSEILDEDTRALRPDPVTNTDNITDEVQPEEDEQIEGQLSLADWMETVREQKYGNRDTKEYSKEELERMLDEKDEKSAAYERLMEEQKEIAKANGSEFNEEEARLKAREKMMLHAAKTDLAIRTGKATVKLEEAVDAMRSMAEQAGDVQEEAANEQTATKETDIAEQITENIQKDTVVSLDTAEIERISDEMLKSAVSEELDMEQTDETEEEIPIGELMTEENTRKVKPSAVKEPEPQVDDIEQEIDEEKKLSGDLAKIFRKYREMPGLESQLASYFETLDKEMQTNTSSYGNILISGNSSSDKTDLARTIVRAINHLYPDRQKKIAKTTGDSINHRGISRAMSKLKGTALIVEGAGSIQPKRIEEITQCLKQDTGRMIVIFEDSDAEMNVLLNFNPDLTKQFNHRIILKQYTVNELVEMARKFARKRQYEVDDDALLELYLKIDKLHSVTDNIRLDDIKEIINKAIAHSEKRASRKFFGGIKKKRGEKGDIFFLTDADFKD